MGHVVQLFGRPALHDIRHPDTSMSEMRERMRRADVEDSLRRLLSAASDAHPGLTLRLTRDAGGRLAVVAVVAGGTPRAVSPAYPEDRLDDFAGVVRAGLPAWTRTLSARLAIRIVS